ncbi:twin-arginine translocation pathway signal [Rhodopseudomonas sp. B29]|uniref:twin-arginine translocation pathway signal n=1 Tax=Rhodopseudomonas sp. B29 TaxID=95607 RepID=UPI001FCAE2C1|nr:twin-arginine translocation pathway signal [Rhodopseudomonas sp. B29]
MFTPRFAAGFSIAGFAALALAGCAAIGDSAVSQAFVDPATYELYDCKQLATERASLAERLGKLERLMRKADTGVAGPVVTEIAYRNDYIAVKARARLADETWRSHRCVDQPSALDNVVVPPQRAPGR